NSHYGICNWCMKRCWVRASTIAIFAKSFSAQAFCKSSMKPRKRHHFVLQDSIHFPSSTLKNFPTGRFSYSNDRYEKTLDTVFDGSAFDRERHVRAGFRASAKLEHRGKRTG